MPPTATEELSDGQRSLQIGVVRATSSGTSTSFTGVYDAMTNLNATITDARPPIGAHAMELPRGPGSIEDTIAVMLPMYMKEFLYPAWLEPSQVDDATGP